MIDGLAFDEHTVLLALGIDIEGKKHVLGIHEGVAENAAACGALLDDIIARGTSVQCSLLFSIDGAKALHSAIVARWGKRAYSTLSSCNVKHWRSGTMILRWCCAAMTEAQSRFRRVKAASSGMPALAAALRENDRPLDGEVDRALDAGQQ